MAESSAGPLSPLAPMMAPMTALQAAPSWRGAPPAPPRAPGADPQRRPPGWALRPGGGPWGLGALVGEEVKGFESKWFSGAVGGFSDRFSGFSDGSSMGSS